MKNAEEEGVFRSDVLVVAEMVWGVKKPAKTNCIYVWQSVMLINTYKQKYK